MTDTKEVVETSETLDSKDISTQDSTDKVTPSPVNQKESSPFDPNKETEICILAGIKSDGNFMFEIMGTRQTLTNLLGLRDLINTRVELEEQKLMGTGEAITRQTAQLLISLAQKVDQVLASVKKPDNQL
jgi:hypothetical protein